MAQLHKRMAAFLLTLLFAAATLTVPLPAQAAADDYPEAWKAKPKDSVADNWGYLNRECVSFAAWRLSARNGVPQPVIQGWGDATEWANEAQERGHTVDTLPAVGAIAWWESGHVAWVVAVAASGASVRIEDYNHDYTGAYNQRDVATNRIARFIHIADLSPPVLPVPKPSLSTVQHWWSPSGMTEVKTFDALRRYQAWAGGWTTPDGWHGGSDADYSLADYNNDGTPDLYKIQHANTPSGKTEVQVMDGARAYAYIGGWVTPQDTQAGTDVQYITGDYNRDGKPDVYAIHHQATATGRTELKILDGASNFTKWIGGWVTPDGWHGQDDVSYGLSVCGTRAAPQLLIIQHQSTQSGMTEVKMLSGNNNYSAWIGKWPSADGWHSGQDVNYAVSGCNNNGKPNAYAILHANTASGMTEVKELQGAASFGSANPPWVTIDGWHDANDVSYVMAN